MAMLDTYLERLRDAGVRPDCKSSVLAARQKVARGAAEDQGGSALILELAVDECVSAWSSLEVAVSNALSRVRVSAGRRLGLDAAEAGSAPVARVERNAYHRGKAGAALEAVALRHALLVGLGGVLRVMDDAAAGLCGVEVGRGGCANTTAAITTAATSKLLLHSLKEHLARWRAALSRFAGAVAGRLPLDAAEARRDIADDAALCAAARSVTEACRAALVDIEAAAAADAEAEAGDGHGDGGEEGERKDRSETVMDRAIAISRASGAAGVGVFAARADGSATPAIFTAESDDPAVLTARLETSAKAVSGDAFGRVGDTLGQTRVVDSDGSGASGGSVLDDLERLASGHAAVQGEKAVVGELARLLLARGGLRGSIGEEEEEEGEEEEGKEEEEKEEEKEEEEEEGSSSLSPPSLSQSPPPSSSSELKTEGSPTLPAGIALGLGAAAAAAAAAAARGKVVASMKVVERR